MNAVLPQAPLAREGTAPSRRPSLAPVLEWLSYAAVVLTIPALTWCGLKFYIACGNYILADFYGQSEIPMLFARGILMWEGIIMGGALIIVGVWCELNE